MCDKWVSCLFRWHCHRAPSYDFSNLLQTDIVCLRTVASYLLVAAERLFVVECLLSWDFIWLTSSALDKQTLLQMLQTCLSCKVSGTEVKSYFWSGRFILECSILRASNALTAFVDHFLRRRLIYCHLFPVSNVFTKHPQYTFWQYYIAKWLDIWQFK